MEPFAAGVSQPPRKGHLIMLRLNLVFLVVVVVAACVALTLLSFLEIKLAFLGRALRKLLT